MWKYYKATARQHSVNTHSCFAFFKNCIIRATPKCVMWHSKGCTILKIRAKLIDKRILRYLKTLSPLSSSKMFESKVSTKVSIKEKVISLKMGHILHPLFFLTLFYFIERTFSISKQNTAICFFPQEVLCSLSVSNTNSYSQWVWPSLRNILK